MLDLDPQARNALSLPFRLPNEILSEIFQFTCAASELTDRSDVLRYVSQVCHRWRHVALACGQLWTQADYQFDHPEWIREQLHRSANIPVIVKAHFPMHSNRGIQNLHLALEVAAIHTLDVQAPPEILDQVLAGLDGHSLQVLSLFIPWSKMPEDAPYPGPAFQLTAPRLRTLALSNFVVSWDAPIFKNLTHLHLHLQSSAFAPSMTQILGMLICSPLLSELILLHAIESSARLPGPESVSVVSLTRLSSFVFDDDILNHIFLLQHLDIPAHCNLSLKVDNKTKKLSLLSEMGHAISQLSSSTAEINKLSVEAGPWNVMVRGYAINPATPLIQITLRCPAIFSEPESASVAGTLLCSLPLVATSALDLIFHDSQFAAVPLETWRMCFKNLEALQSLQVKPSTPRNLLSALAASEDGSVLLPRLQRLEIHHPDVGPTRPRSSNYKLGGHSGNWWHGIEVTEVTFFDVLLTCLSSRRRSKAESLSLSIARCPPCPGHLESLKALVKDVSWESPPIL
ncbi:hypothetical protein B0H11DRAFT_2273569 [Mycena galericulata]|nr:hypothetical protein B0H11DRAFT_2273569 [Mycena galericulata]